MTTVDAILELFAVAGKAAYFGEAVSQTEHALQSAYLGVQSGADRELVVAALLHDVGHLLRGLPEHAAQDAIDDEHEDIGAAWLDQHFRPAVSVPVRLHVPAKRYLCAVEPAYHVSLSAASKLSLRLQGGPMTAEQVDAFEKDPHHASAVVLRRWDDAAKIPDLDVPGLDFYREHLESALKLGESLT
jgi:phosphonate degradation associated HDIG domain protein